MIKRTKDAETIQRVMEPYLPLEGFDPSLWSDNPNNIALIDEKDNLVLLEYNLPNVYTGHWFFNSRGKEAVSVAIEMRDEIFSAYGAKVVRGLTPLQKLGARWLAKRVGFKSHGVTHTPTGPCELFILTKEDL